MNEFVEALKFNADGLIPAIAQDAGTKEILMQAFMNKAAVEKTLECNKAVFYSRSRKKLWLKGETSGNYLVVQEMRVDCDLDCILLLVEPKGPACHTGNTSCFYRKYTNGKFVESPVEPSKNDVLEEVYNVICDRRENPKEKSYTNYLFEKGIDKMLKKVGEESAEIIIAAKNPDVAETRYEIADLMYHLSVVMAERGLCWEDIYGELRKRQA